MLDRKSILLYIAASENFRWQEKLITYAIALASAFQPLIVFGSTPNAKSISTISRPSIVTNSKMAAAHTLSQQQIYFETNAGQADASVKFIARGKGHNFLLTQNAAIFAATTRSSRLTSRDEFITRHLPTHRVTPDVSSHNSKQISDVVKMRFAYANQAARISGANELSSKSNYLLGKNETTWRKNVSHFAQVKYDNLYPGIDLVYYGKEQKLEYDFVVAAGANPTAIQMNFAGAQNLHITDSGDLVISTNASQIINHKPVVYQEIAGQRKEITAQYKLLGKNTVGFALGVYDTNYTLVIDPVMSFGTTWGTADDTIGNGIATDKAGNAYITGIAYSVKNTEIGKSGIAHVFVTKLSASGQLIYNTYIGAVGEEVGFAIDVDNQGHAFVTGHADNKDFPVTKNAYQTKFGGLCDVFVLQLTPRGDDLVYSTFLGGSNEETGLGIGVDAAGNAYIAGETLSKDFPVINPLIRFGQATTEAFVTKLNPAGNRLLYSTALSGPTTNPEGGSAVFALAVDRRGNAAVAGFTTSEKFPTANPLQPALNGTIDGFVSKLNSNGTRLDFSTYLGGAGEDACFGIALDASQNVYVTGLTSSTNFPAVNAIQNQLGGTTIIVNTTEATEALTPPVSGRDDAFITKLIPSGNAVIYSTYLGGAKDDVGFSIAVNDAGEAHITGRTRSADFPTEDPLSASLNGDIDGFIAKGSADGRKLIYSSYIGGTSEEKGFCVTTWRNNFAYYTGLTTSSNWLPTNYVPPKLTGAANAFALGILSNSAPPQLTSVSAANYQRGALACDSIAAAFGVGITSDTEAAESIDLPAELGEATIKITDSAGKQLNARIFFASPYQVNYQIPADAAPGPALLELTKADGSTFTENIEIDTLAPGLFTADASGQGVAAGYITRVKAGKIVGNEPIATSENGRLAPLAIDLGADDEEVILILFGTGLRHRNANGSVTAKLGGNDAQVLYAGLQPYYVSLDQINIHIPKSLRGRGIIDLNLNVDGKNANAVQISVK